MIDKSMRFTYQCKHGFEQIEVYVYNSVFEVKVGDVFLEINGGSKEDMKNELSMISDLFAVASRNVGLMESDPINSAC